MVYELGVPLPVPMDDTYVIGLVPEDPLKLTVMEFVDDVRTVTIGIAGRVVKDIVEDKGDFPYIFVVVNAKE